MSARLPGCVTSRGGSSYCVCICSSSPWSGPCCVSCVSCVAGCCCWLSVSFRVQSRLVHLVSRPLQLLVVRGFTRGGCCCSSSCRYEALFDVSFKQAPHFGIAAHTHIHCLSHLGCVWQLCWVGWELHRGNSCAAVCIVLTLIGGKAISCDGAGSAAPCTSCGARPAALYVCVYVCAGCRQRYTGLQLD